MGWQNSFPGGARFAFTIVDDTDGSKLDSIVPFYDLLTELGMRTTKTVWVFLPRDGYTGDTLQDAHYVAYMQELHGRGFEIALHNVGSGSFLRDEIIRGLRDFKDKIGCAPRLLANHGSNPDCVYWGAKRFRFPIGTLFGLLRDNEFYGGEIETSQHFWGDWLQKEITYVRNHTFADINLDRRDRWMPYHDPRKPYVNCWFSSVDCRSIQELLNVLTERNIDRLEQEGGVCILYTHVAYGLVGAGGVHDLLRRRLEYLAKKNGYFAPASELLDHLRERRGVTQISDRQARTLDAHWFADHARIAAKEKLRAQPWRQRAGVRHPRA